MKNIALSAVYDVIIGIIFCKRCSQAIVGAVLTLALGKVLLHFNHQ